MAASKRATLPASSPEARPFRLYRIPLQSLSGVVAPCGRRCPTPSEAASTSRGACGGEEATSSRTLTVPGTEGGSLQKHGLLAEPTRGLSRSCSSSPTPHQPPFLVPPK